MNLQFWRVSKTLQKPVLLTGGVAQLGLPNISTPLQQAADAIHVVVFRCNVQGGPRGDRETFAEIMEDAWGGSYPVIRKNGVGTDFAS